MKTLIKIGITAAIILGPSLSEAQDVNIWDGVSTQEQVDRGKQVYAETCAACHGVKLTASDPDFPNLTGSTFVWNWKNKSLDERFERISTTMPPGAAGSLTSAQYTDVIAFILNFNGYPVGQQELPADIPMLSQFTVSLKSK